MRSKEFIQDSVLDNMVAQVKQPKTPPPGTATPPPAPPGTANTKLAANASDAEIKAWMAANPGQQLPGTTQTTVQTPYNQSGLGNFIGGQVGKNSPPPTTLGGKIAQGAANAVSPTNIANKATSAISGLGNALKAGAQSGLGGVSVAYKGPPGQQKQAGAAPLGNQPIDYIPGKIDAHVADYLTKAANRQPLKQSTGNQNIDTILKAAGLLR
jgi:hypothetical protein